MTVGVALRGHPSWRVLDVMTRARDREGAPTEGRPYKLLRKGKIPRLKEAKASQHP